MRPADGFGASSRATSPSQMLDDTAIWRLDLPSTARSRLRAMGKPKASLPTNSMGPGAFSLRSPPSGLLCSHSILHLLKPGQVRRAGGEHGSDGHHSPGPASRGAPAQVARTPQVCVAGSHQMQNGRVTRKLSPLKGASAGNTARVGSGTRGVHHAPPRKTRLGLSLLGPHPPIGDTRPRESMPLPKLPGALTHHSDTLPATSMRPYGL